MRHKEQPYLFIGWFWFIGTLIPVIGIIKIGDFAMADRYMYMPVTGILVMATWKVGDVLDRASVSKFLLTLAAGLILAGGNITGKYLGKMGEQ